jgi:hypothetical protein
LFPDARGDSKYAQLYFYNADDALRWRIKWNDELDSGIMDSLQNLLMSFNRYSNLFLHTFQILDGTPSINIALRILVDPSTDLHQYNTPTVDEIAVIIPGDDSHAFNPHDVVLHSCDGQLSFIHDYHRAYAPLHYNLLLPHGTDSWTLVHVHTLVNFTSAK